MDYLHLFKRLFVFGALMFFAHGASAFDLSMAFQNRIFLASALSLTGSCGNIIVPFACDRTPGCVWIVPRIQGGKKPQNCSPTDCAIGVDGCQWQTQTPLDNLNDMLGVTNGTLSLNFSKVCVGQKKTTSAQVNPGYCGVDTSYRAPSGNANTPPAPAESKKPQVFQPWYVRQCSSAPGCPAPCVNVAGKCQDPASWNGTQNVSAQIMDGVKNASSGKGTCESDYAGKKKIKYYDAGTVAVGGAGGYSICTDKGWKPCSSVKGSECGVEDLTIVPSYLKDTYNAALQKNQKTNQDDTTRNTRVPVNSKTNRNKAL